MFIFLIFSLAIIGSSFYKFKETFLFYCALKMLALSGMCIRYNPPALSMETLLNLFFLFEFLRRGYLHNILKLYKRYPLRIYYSLSFLSIILSGICSIMPGSQVLTTTVQMILDDFVVAFLFWVLVKNVNDVKRFLVYAKFIILLACAFGIYEYIIDKNVFFGYLSSNVKEDYLLGKIYNTEQRLGMRRITSLFVSPNNFIYGAFIVIIIYMYNTYIKVKIKNFSLFFFIVFILILLANSRTVLVSSIVLFVPVWFSLFRNKNSLLIILITALIIIATFPFWEKYSANITSVLSTSEKDEIEGSSVSMRINQLQTSFFLFLQSPLVGKGIRSISYYTSEDSIYRSTLFGAESIWFQLLIERGILGLLAYFSLFIEVIHRYKIFNNKFFLFYSLGYFVANTMSSLPGFSLSFLYIGYFCMDIVKKDRYNL